MVRLQIERGTDINSKDGFGQTALIAAVNSKSENIVRLLLECGADLTACDANGLTAMHKVFTPYYQVKQKTGYLVPILRLLAEFEAKLSTQTSGNPAGDSFSIGHISLINRRNQQWETPMHIFTNFIPLSDDALRWMSDNGADLNAGTG